MESRSAGLASRLRARVVCRVRPDGAAFIGSAICFLSLFFPWVVREFPFWYTPPRGPTPIRFWFEIKMEWSFADFLLDSDFTVILLMFLIGTAVALFFRTGVVFQAIGLAGFLLLVPSHFFPDPMRLPLYDAFHQYYLGPGYFIALFGVFISMFAAKNFWWQRETHAVVPSISRVTALAPNSTRARTP